MTLLQSQSARLMIVEDQRVISADLEGIMGKLGYNVVAVCSSGEEAILAIAKVKPDVVLMDIRLAGKMDGIDAAAQIKEQYGIPLVYLTAYEDEETIVRAKLTTPFGYVVKPYTSRELRAAIEIALYRHRSEQQVADERARRRAAEDFKLMLDSVEGYGILRLDPLGRIASWNVGIERISGYAPAAVMGSPLSRIYTEPDADGAEHMPWLEPGALLGRSTREGTLLCADGHKLWTSLVVSPLPAGGETPPGFVVLLRDLSEEKRLRDGRAYLDLATATLGSSLDFGETVKCAAACALGGLADGVLIELSDEKADLTPVAIVHREDAQRERMAMMRSREAYDPKSAYGPLAVLRAGEPQAWPPFGTKGDGASRLGSEHPEIFRELDICSYVSAPIECQRNTIGVVTFVRCAAPTYQPDELRVVQEFARRAGLSLENSRLLERANAAVAARDEFLQIASHELKTPLAPLMLQLEMVARDIARSGEGNKKLVQKIERAAAHVDRLARLIERLLDVSRITAGRFSLQLAPLELGNLVHEVVERFIPEARQVGSSIELEATALRGRMDPLRIEQLISNLLSNAIKYGGGRPIHVALRKLSGSNCELTVTDHGIGIAKEAQERIFARFERAASSFNVGGLGLGLFIARRIVDAHGGKISVRSDEGGTVFTVQMPLEPIAESKAEIPARATFESASL